MSFVPVGPRPDIIEEVTTVGAASAGAGLFDSLEIPTALVGTSYSTAGIWNFEGAVKAALDADVLMMAEEGHGPFTPMRKYLEGPALADPRPDLVIWEIPVRYLGIESPQ
jgi:alginate O-acetyltransferase complex protein AlgJ